MKLEFPNQILMEIRLFTDIHVIPIATRQFIYEIGQLRIRGDVIIRCYQISTNDRHSMQSTKTINRDLIFSTQFHTCAIVGREITFYRNDLDYACEGTFLSILFANSGRWKILQFCLYIFFYRSTSADRSQSDPTF